MAHLKASLFKQSLVILFDLVKRILLERAFDIVQYVVHMMLIWSSRAGSFVIWML